MAFTTRLNPPQISSKIPAFYGETMTIPFVLHKAVSIAQVQKIAIIVKTVSTNNQVMTGYASSYYYDYEKHCYFANFNLENNFVPLVGQYYKVSIACVGADDVIGFYSTTGIIKYTTRPSVIIQGREGTVNNTYEYTGVYSQKDGDATEKVYSYCFNLYDSNNVLIATTGDQIHNSSTDTDLYQSTDSWTIRKALEPNVSYTIEYVITTMNGLVQPSPRYEIIEVQFEDPSVHADLSATCYPDDGYVKVSLVGKRDEAHVNGYCVLLRSSSEDNFDSWCELTRFQLCRWYAGDRDTESILELCKDHTVAQGFSYKYAIQAYNSVGTYSNRMLNIEGDVVCDFEDAFLWDGERQLKIRFNPKITGFKSSVLETKTNTIGSKYPFIFRNGNVEYKEFQISGLLSLLSDENDEFLTGLYNKGDNKRFETPAAAGYVASAGQQLTAENYRKERQFKLDVLAWLTNGKPKLFRSAAEGNYIVRLMNATLTPNDTLGRMLHTFNCSACEVAEYNFDNLQSYGFTVPSYVETRTLQFAQIDWAKGDELPNGANWVDEKTISLPSACMASITNALNLHIKATFADGTTKDLKVSGTYIFDEQVLKANPLIRIALLGENWGEAQFTYAYYDSALDSFSFIHKITTTDRVIQMLGETDINLITRLEDVRLKTGAFHYIRVQPRNQIQVYLENGNYYYNHSGDKVSTLTPIYIYPIVNRETGKITHYLDGRYGIETARLIDTLSYDFKLIGSKTVDFSLSNTPTTSARYEALTNINSISELYAGDGVILDIVYQENELLYAVEVQSSDCPDTQTLIAKSAWLTAKDMYDTALQKEDTSEDTLITLEAEVNRTYKMYITLLEAAVEKVKEDHNVDFAI